MDRGAWQDIVHGVTESDTTGAQTHTHIIDIEHYISFKYSMFVYTVK